MRKLLLVLLFSVIALPFAWSASSFSEEEGDKEEKCIEAAEQAREEYEEEDEDEEGEEGSENRASIISPGKFYSALNVLILGAPAFAEEPEGKPEEAIERAKEEGEEEEKPEDPEKAALNKALGKFYMALNALFTGNVEPMTEVWSHAEDVTYMPPDGKYLVGWESTLQSWQEQASLNLRGSIRPTDINYNIGSDIAVVHNYEVGSNIVDGQKKEAKIRVTNLFRKEDGEWKMIGHHADNLPYLIQDEGEGN